MNKPSRLLFSLATSLAIAFVPARAGNTFNVTNTNGDTSAGTLGAAISNASADTSNSDTITFSSLFNTPQEIDLTGSYVSVTKTAGESFNLTAPSSLTINSELNSGLTFIGGGEFYLGNVTLEGAGGPSNAPLSVSGGSTVALSNDSLIGLVNLNQGTLQTVTGLAVQATIEVTGTDTINVNAGQTSTFSGQILGTGTLVTGGSGTLVLANNFNNYLGGTQINEGTLEVSQQLATATPLGSGPIAINGAGTLAIGSNSFIQNNVALKAGGGTFALDTAPTVELSSITRTAGGGLVIVPSGSTTLGSTQRVVFSTAPTVTNGIIDASIVAANSATDTSADFLTYTTANGPEFGLVRATYSSATQITNGVTNGTTSTSVFHATNMTDNNVSAPTALYALKVDSGVTLNGQPITLGDGTNTAGLIISGNTSTSPTTINTGITFATGSTGAIYVGGNGTSVYTKINGFLQGSSGLTVNGNGYLQISEAGYSGLTTINGATVEFDNVGGITPGVAVTSTINLAGTLGYQGGTINGTINLTADGGIINPSSSILNLQGTVNGNGHTLTLGSLSSALIEAHGIYNNVAGFNIAGGTTQIYGTLGSASAPIQLSSNTAVLLDETSTTIANPIVLTGGTIETVATSTFTGPISVGQGTGSITFNTINSQAGTLTLSGPLSGTVPLFIEGAGKVALTGSSSSYSGAIVTTAANLDITGSLSKAQVQGGNVSGTGTIGLLLLNAGTRIHPGELGAIGTLTASGLQWYSDGTPQLQFQLSNTSSASSLLDLGSGAFTNEGGNTTFAFDFLSTGQAGQDYDLINFGAGDTNFLASEFTATDLAPNLSAQFEFVTNGDTESLMVDVVPEPRTNALIIVGLVALAALSRSRSRKS